MRGDAAPIREINPAIPASVASLIVRLHAKNPGERFQSAKEVADELERIRTSPLSASETRDEPNTEKSQESVLSPFARRLIRQFNRKVVVLALIACLGLGLIAVWSFLPRFQISLSPEQATETKEPPENMARSAGPFGFPSLGTTAWMDQSPNGKMLAVPRGNDVVVFETPHGQYQRTLKGPGERVTFVKFSPDNQLLAASADRNFVRVWEAATGRELFTLEPPTRHAPEHRVMLTFSPESAQLITAVREQISVWDARSGKELQVLEADTGGVHSMCFRPGHPQLAVASWLNNCVTIWNWDGGKLKESRTLEGHSSSVGQVLYSPDGKWLASADRKKFKVWNAETLQSIHTVETPIGKLEFTPDSRILYVAPLGSRERTYAITRWDAASKEQLPSVPMEGMEIAYPCLSRNGKVLYVCELETAMFVRVLDAVTGKEQFPHPEHADAIGGLAVSPDGKTLASGGADGTVRLWDLERWQMGKPLPRVRTLKKHKAAICCLAFSPDNQRFVSVDEDATAIVWNAGEGTEVYSLSGLTRGSVQVGFSPDGKLLAAGAADGRVLLWDAATGAKRTPLRWQTKAVRALAFSSDGRQLASAGDDDLVHLGEVNAVQSTRTFAVNSGVVALAWAPDDRALAACRQGGKDVALWDLETNKPISVQTDPGAIICCVTFQPKSELLAAGSMFGQVYYLDRSGAETSSSALNVGVTRIAFIGEGRYLAAGRRDGSITILRAPKPASAGD